MASAGITKYDGKYWGVFCCLVVQVVEKRLRGVHWISSFTPKVKFYIPQDEKDLEKTFDNLENIYGERVEKMPFNNESNDISNGMS